MTTTIHHQITVDVGDVTDEPITLWFVSHGIWPESDMEDRHAILIDALSYLFTQRGWTSDLYDALYESDLPAAPNGCG